MSDTTIETPAPDAPAQLSAPLVQEGQALESSRDAGYDLAAAVGEPVDNSIQAGARIIRIRTTTATEGKTKRISEIAFADDGLGIAPETLASALSLGFGTRINDRSGLGRFGMGLKLATLSQARRCDIWSRQAGSDAVFHTFLDLDQIQAGEQTQLTATQVDGFPTEWRELMSDPRKSQPFSSGTLVVWSNVDRLVGGGRFGAAIDERLSELLYFLKRGYRRFIDEGLYIELDGKEVHLHDPLFLLDMPRVVERFDNAKADILGDDTIEIDGHKVHVRVTLLPEVFRRVRGVGGYRGDEGKQFADLYIPENEGKVSILREGREIYYDIVPKLLPGGTERIDRFIGVEISFPATLDEYFRVRNVKRGAEPDGKLRGEIRKLVERPVKIARDRIQADFSKNDLVERKDATEHEAAHTAVERAAGKLPQGRAGAPDPSGAGSGGTSGSGEGDSDGATATGEATAPRSSDDVIAELELDLQIGPDDEKKREQIRYAVEELPVTLIDLEWPGNGLLDIEHLNGKAVVKLNNRHPFMRSVYRPLKEVAAKEPDQLNAAQVIDLARKAEVALDVLFMAYAFAENMNPNADQDYASLRSYWGQFSGTFVTEALRGS